jgi:hypothetical protein
VKGGGSKIYQYGQTYLTDNRQLISYLEEVIRQWIKNARINTNRNLFMYDKTDTPLEETKMTKLVINGYSAPYYNNIYHTIMVRESEDDPTNDPKKPYIIKYFRDKQDNPYSISQGIDRGSYIYSNRALAVTGLL